MIHTDLEDFNSKFETFVKPSFEYHAHDYTTGKAKTEYDPLNLGEWQKSYLYNRLKHLDEERLELERSLDEHDEIGFIDALVDLSYIALGTLSAMGYQVDGHWSAVHAANMRRVLSKEGPSHKLGVIKPDDWIGPDEIHKILISEKDD